MSVEITTAFVDQFRNNVTILAQQEMSRLRDCVMSENVTGEYAYFEQIGATSMQEVTSRHSDTAQIDTPHSRRQVTMRSFQWADLIDREDRVRTLIDPTNPYSRNAAAAAGRQIDDLVIEAFNASANTGRNGGTSVPLPSSQQIVNGSAGLTVAKLRSAREILLSNEAMQADETCYICVTAEQIDDLLGDSTVTSSDYNTVKALVQGEIDTFVGFKFVRSERLPVASSIRSCFAWCPSGMMLAVGQDVQTRISERPDKRYATQVFLSMSFGATRMEEEKVVQIDCLES